MTDQQEVQTLEDQLGALTRFVARHNDLIRVRPGGSTTRTTQRAGAETKKT